MRTDDVSAKPLTLRKERAREIPALLMPVLTLAVVALLWVLSLRALDLRHINDFGLVSILPAAYFLALAILTISFGVTVHNRHAPVWLLLLHVVLLICLIHGTPSLGYGTLRYSWAWKHVGMVDYIQRHGTVDPNLSSLAGLSANHNWPGFFALGALFTEAGGFATSLDFAALSPLFFNLLNCAALLLILGSMVQDRRLKWLAVWFFFLGNWIGQDYFAPQALSYFLFLVIIGVSLTWFTTRARTQPRAAAGKLRPWQRPLLYWERLWGWLEGHDDTTRRGDLRVTPLQRAGVMAVMIVLFTAIAGTHQLTPFMAILSVTALVVTYRISPRSLPLLMGVITAMWALYMAWAFVSGNIDWIAQTVGRLGSNSTVTPLTKLSQAQVTVATVARALSGAVGLLAMLGALRRWRRGQRDLAFMLLAVAPVPMFFVTSYGGEMIFRVYYFALPYMAFFAAALFYPTPVSGRSWRTAPLVIATSAVLLAGLLFAYYGRERTNYFTQNEVDAASFLYDKAPPGSLLVAASYNYPSLFKNYELFTHATLTGETTNRQVLRIQSDPVAAIQKLKELLDSNQQYPATFVIITRSQEAQIQMDNLLPPGALASFEQKMRQSPSFRLIYENEDAAVFELAAPQSQVSP